MDLVTKDLEGALEHLCRAYNVKDNQRRRDEANTIAKAIAAVAVCIEWERAMSHSRACNDGPDEPIKAVVTPGGTDATE